VISVTAICCLLTCLVVLPASQGAGRARGPPGDLVPQLAMLATVISSASHEPQEAGFQPASCSQAAPYLPPGPRARS